MFHGSYSEIIITIKKIKADLYFSFVMHGIPPSEMPSCIIGKDAAHPGKLDNHTDKGKLVYVSLYAIEETKSIISEWFFVEEGKRVKSTRTLREDGLMDFRVDATKKDGTSQYYTAVYKRA
jgi:hypothetical protein